MQSLHEDESAFPPFISFAGFGTHDYIYSFAMAQHDCAGCGQRRYLLDRARFRRLRPKKPKDQMEELVEERLGNEDGEGRECRQIGNTKPEFTDAIYGWHVFKRR